MIIPVGQTDQCSPTSVKMQSIDKITKYSLFHYLQQDKSANVTITDCTEYLSYVQYIKYIPITGHIYSIFTPQKNIN